MYQSTRYERDARYEKRKRYPMLWYSNISFNGLATMTKKATKSRPSLRLLFPFLFISLVLHVSPTEAFSPQRMRAVTWSSPGVESHPSRATRIILRENEESPQEKPTRKTSQPLLRFVNNLWYIMSSPFPDLRKVTRRREIDNKSLVLSVRLRDGVAAVFAYLALGALTYRYLFEKWSFVDALYFTTVLFSTVGYGDLCATSIPGKVFSCLFGIAGIALLGAAVATIGSRLVAAETATIQMAKKQSQKRLLQIYDKMPKVVTEMRNSKISKAVTNWKDSTTTDAQERLQDIRKELFSSLPQPKLPRFLSTFWNAVRYIVQSLLLVALGGLIIGRLEGWAWYDSLYYSLITASTIGLGDFSPQTQAGRLAAVVFIPVSVAAVGEILASIGTAIVTRRQKKLFNSQLNTGLNSNVLEEMDVNGDGKVAREEYVSYMLMEMGLVSREELEELWDQFERLDVSKSGYLDQEDLMLMAKLRESGEFQS